MGSTGSGEFFLLLLYSSLSSSRPVTTSLKVAEVFGKNHKDVLKAITFLDCSESFAERNFAPCSYGNKGSRQYPMFELTRDGFTFLCMGFTGKKAAKFKEAYIAEFNARGSGNRMEAALYGGSGWAQQAKHNFVLCSSTAAQAQPAWG